MKMLVYRLIKAYHVNPEIIKYTRKKNSGNFLEYQGLNMIKDSKGRGGHEKWARSDLDRPVILQTHVDPVPEFIVKQALRHLNISREEFNKIMGKI